MNYPECSGEGCRFTNEGDMVTLLHSPIVYDQSGAPIGGGSNRVNRMVSCRTCNRRWVGNLTKLQIAQGVPWSWREIKEGEFRK